MNLIDRLTGWYGGRPNQSVLYSARIRIRCACVVAPRSCTRSLTATINTYTLSIALAVRQVQVVKSMTDIRLHRR